MKIDVDELRKEIISQIRGFFVAQDAIDKSEFIEICRSAFNHLKDLDYAINNEGDLNEQ